MTPDDLRSLLSKLGQRHFERKEWPSQRNNPGAAADGYLHYCGGCLYRQWPCPEGRLVNLAPQLLALWEAARRLSDKRTADWDGFWVSAREMRYLDAALYAPTFESFTRVRDALNALEDAK